MPVTPTTEQQIIVSNTSRVVLIEAVAGAGKTTTLALVAAQAQLAPARILALCFTQGAKGRLIEKLLQEGAARGISVLTMEEWAQTQIQRLVQLNYLERPKTYRNDESIRHHLVAAANGVWERCQQRGGGSDFNFAFEHDNKRLEELLLLLTRLKSTLSSLQFYEDDCGQECLDALAEEFDVPAVAIEICRAYEMRRQAVAGEFLWQTAADFVPDLVLMLRIHSQAISEIQAFSLILVDEWHDVNAAEFTLLQIVKRSARLLVVGDRDQTIHTARGADLHFSTTGFDLGFPGATRLSLSQTQRFGPALSRMASRSIHPRNCLSIAGSHTMIRQVNYSPDDPNHCATLVVTQIKKIFEEEAKTSYGDIAVIVREADQSLAIENAFLDSGMAYHCEGFDSYLLRPEILMLRALLHLVADDFTSLRNDSDACKRMVAALTLYLAVPIHDQRWQTDYHSENTTGQAFSWIEQATQTIIRDPETLAFFIDGVLCKQNDHDSTTVAGWRAQFAAAVAVLKADFKQSSAVEVLNYINTQLRLKDATSRAFISRGRADSASRSIRSFISFAARFQQHNAGQFLAELGARQEKAAKYRARPKTERQITLTTVAASKGQEWPHVLIPYMQENEFPRRNDKAEEKRYFYVGITRAMESLSLFEPDDKHAHLRSSLLHGARETQ